MSYIQEKTTPNFMNGLKKYIFNLSNDLLIYCNINTGWRKSDSINTAFHNEKAVPSGFCVTLYILGLALGSCYNYDVM